MSVYAEPARESVTVAEYAKEWQAANAVPGGWAHTTAMHYRYMLDNHILSGWGSVRLQDVSRRAVKA